MKKMSQPNIITLDGKEYEFTKGETILDVAKRVGIFIPQLCYIDNLPAYGGCRLCIVKIIGDRKPFQTACSTAANPGMKIITKDDELQAMRKETIQLILSEHPYSCLICGHALVCDDLKSHPDKRPSDRNFGCFACSSKDTCHLRKVVEYLDIKHLEYPFFYKNIKPESNSLFFETDFNLCILCGKCVRVCSDLRGYNAIDLLKRGNKSRIATGMQVSRTESGCQYCGACVDICPVGVYTPKRTTLVSSKSISNTTVCGFCSLGCTLSTITSENKLIDTIPSVKPSINRDQLCVIGRFCIPPFFSHEKRQTRIQIKKDSGFSDGTWDDTLNTLKNQFSKYKPEEIGILGSPNLSNEAAYLLHLFACKVIKTPNFATIIKDEQEDCILDMFKEDRKINKIQEAKRIIIINANPQYSHPILFMHLNKAKQNGSIITVFKNNQFILPYETEMLVDEELDYNLKAIQQLIIKEKGEKRIILLGNSKNPELVKELLDFQSHENDLIIFPLYNSTNLERVFSLLPNSSKIIFEKIESGQIKAIYSTERIPEQYRNKLELFVLQDIFESESTLKADIVLPAATHFESDGSFTNIEFGTSFYTKTINPPDQAISDWEIVQKIAAQFQKGIDPAFEARKPNEILSLIPSIFEKSDFQVSKSRSSTPLKAPTHLFSYGEHMFRGVNITDMVDDFQRFVDQIEMKEKPTQNESITSNLKKGEVYKNITLTSSGNIRIGDDIFGLSALKTILEVSQAAGENINLILEPNNSHLYYLPSEEFCVCNNYRNNLSESKLLIHLNPDKGLRLFIKIQDEEGEEIYRPSNGIVLIHKDFVDCTKNELESTFSSEKQNESQISASMQANALSLAWAVSQKASFRLKTSLALDDQSPNWGVWADLTPNTKLLRYLAPKSAPTDLEKNLIVEVATKKCMGCGTCFEICPHEAITIQQYTETRGIFKNQILKYSQINPEKCFKCAKCVIACPIGAISIKQWDQMEGEN